MTDEFIILSLIILPIITILIVLFGYASCMRTKRYGEFLQWKCNLYTNGYYIGIDEKGLKYIKCLNCGRKSYNENDIKYHYCGNCHKFLRYRSYWGNHEI